MSHLIRFQTYLEWHSWLDYEHLPGLDSHLSRVYHAMATQVGFGLITVESSKAAQLLGSLSEAGFKSILLKLHTDQGECSKSAFFIQNPFDVTEPQDILSSISADYGVAPYAIPDSGKARLKIYGIPEADCRRFPLINMRPHHLRRILSLMLETKITLIETGVFTANPLICRQVYTQAGLVSDVPFHLLSTAWSRLDSSLIRFRIRNQDEQP